MEWQEVRSLYPNQFVKLQVLESRIDEDREVIEDVVVIGTIADEDATRELLQSKSGSARHHSLRILLTDAVLRVFTF